MDETLFLRAPAAEFPNDNPELHDGARWSLATPRGAPRALVRTRTAGSASPPAAVLQPVLEIVAAESPLPSPAAPLVAAPLRPHFDVRARLLALRRQPSRPPAPPSRLDVAEVVATALAEVLAAPAASVGALEPGRVPAATAPAEAVAAEAAAEPVVSEPVVSEPVLAQAGVSEPVVSEPVLAEAAVSEPVVSEPVVSEPVLAEAAVSEPVVSEPVVSEPVLAEAAVSEPVVSEPVVSEGAPEEAVVTPIAPADPFARLVKTLSRVALDGGATRAAAVIEQLLTTGRAEGAGLDAQIVAGLAARRIARAEGDRLTATETFAATSRAWAALLRAESDDLDACGELTLDAWSTEILSAFLGGDRGQSLKRDVRRRGIAAFGLIDQAA